MDKVIEVQNLKKIYALAKGKQLNALDGVAFKVFAGEIFGILGPNGAGKTTALEIIECLKQQTSGMVTVLGLDNLKEPDEIKKRIGIQLQSSQYLHHLSLGELLDLFRSLYTSVPSRVHPRDPLPQTGKGSLRSSSDALLLGRDGKHSLLRLVGLEDKEHQEFKDLSGGQKQRFTIATALVHKPEILFLDEPTTGLDPSARRSLWDLIKQINSQGITIVLTTHFMEEAELLCHRVAIMDSGKILEIDQPKKLIDRLSDSVQVSFFTDKEIPEPELQSLPSVKKVYSVYPKVILELSSLDNISALVTALKQKNITFYGFTVKTATLEDVYLQLTGRAYEE